MSPTPATERVFSIPELLRHIFDYSAPEYNLSYVLVCRQWLGEALAARWNVVHNPCNLLRLLAPLAPLEPYDNWLPDIYAFTRPIRPEDWECFDKYAWRVHNLFFSKDFDPSVFDAISSSRPRDVLLPNLRELRPHYDPHALPLFANPSLRGVYIGPTSYGGVDDVDHFIHVTFRCLPSVAPRLEVLWLVPDVPFLSSYEGPLATTISKLAALKDLHLPSRWLTPAVTEATAALPNLLTIDTSESKSAAAMDGDEELFPPSLPPGSFPVLKHLNIEVQYQRFATSFSQACSPSSLSSLSLVSPRAESSSDFARLLDVVSRCCPDLEELHLMNIDTGDVTVPVEPITLATFAPLLSCSKLRTLDLFHPTPFKLYAEDVITIVKALPCLVELHLCQWAEICHPALHISVLSALASLDTNLEILGIEMDTLVDDRLDANGIAQFTKLQELEIGSSPLSDPLPIARYLDRVLPDGCAISYRNSDEPYSPGMPLAERWAQVIEFICAPTESLMRSEGGGQLLPS